MEVRKGQRVRYSVWHDPAITVNAIVRRAHRDGTATVEAQFFVRDGKEQPGYLGYRYRLYAGDLTEREG